MAETPTDVQDLFDELTGGLQSGDNVVLQTDHDSDGDLVLAAALQSMPDRAPLVYISFRLSPAEVHRRFAAGWDPERFLLVDCGPSDAQAEPAPDDVLVRHLQDATPDGVRSTVHAVTREFDTGATYVFDGLTGMQERWGPDEALSLFLWACPKLYEERTIAYWTLQRPAHTPAFRSRLAQVTQVVINLGHDGDRRWMELGKAHGRPADLVGARVEYRADGQGVCLLDRIPATRHRVGRLIKQQRLCSGLSQSELARRVGISPSALSQTERGHHGVSGDVLLRVWEALGVSLSTLQTGPATHEVFPRSGRTFGELHPGVIAETIVQSPSVTAHLIVWEPGASGHRPLFATKRPEFVVVLEGVLQLSIGQSEETLQQGDAILVREPVRAWRNPAHETARAAWTLLA
ncbi:MAG: helix-turn-helix domain-containing protein [Egibacteraceae bacterium]